MFLPSVTSQPLATQYFQRVFASGRLSHAYIFWGAKGSGKYRFALEVAKALHCQTGQPCGSCSVCRSVDHGNDPSVHVFGPNEDRPLIGIDTVRALCERVHFKSERMQVVILRQAELLGETAANAILKTLEEPPPDTLLILLAQSTGSLPTTIVSRCHRIPFARESAEPAGRAVDTLAMVNALREPAFFSREEPRPWLSETFPESKSAREAVRELLERLVVAFRRECEHCEGEGLDEILGRLELFFELTEALDGNVQADLVFEKLLADLRR